MASLSVGSGKGGEDEALKALYRKYVRNEHNTSTGRKPVSAKKHAIPHSDVLPGKCTSRLMGSKVYVEQVLDFCAVEPFFEVSRCVFLGVYSG